MILAHVLWDCGKVESECAVELHINEARTENLAIQIDNLVGNHVVFVEDLLAVKNLACDGADPKIFVNELVSSH